MAIHYLSVCSGIEAFSVAMRGLPFSPVAFSEIKPFPCAVLAHHYPDMPNLGDMTKIDGEQYYGAVDLIVGGTPCQDFSVAGKRAGMAGERGGLPCTISAWLIMCHRAGLVGEMFPESFPVMGGTRLCPPCPHIGQTRVWVGLQSVGRTICSAAT